MHEHCPPLLSYHLVAHALTLTSNTPAGPAFETFLKNILRPGRMTLNMIPSASISQNTGIAGKYQT